jgi:hypothetical protein
MEGNQKEDFDGRKKEKGFCGRVKKDVRVRIQFLETV